MRGSRLRILHHVGLEKLNSMGSSCMNLSNYMGGWSLRKLNSMGDWVKKKCRLQTPSPQVIFSGIALNRTDPDVMPHYVAFHLGLPCLQKDSFRVFWSSKG